MGRAINRLSASGVKTASVGKHADGGGLWLVKREDGGAQWVLRVTVHGRRREMGLGAYPDRSLKEAREVADTWRAVARQGLDPIKERERQRREAARNIHMLADIALDAFESRKAELKGDGKAGRWFSPLELHVLPKLGRVPVADIDQKDIRDTLAPIWHTKAATAEKAMSRLTIVLRHAAALGLEVDLQATEKAKALLGRQRHTVTNVPSLPWQDVPAFYQSLGGSITELALRLLILTGARSGPLRNIHVEQIDGDVWTIPADDMKGRKGATKEFRVPLSAEAQRVIAEARKFARDGFLFPGAKRGVISDMTMTALMDRRGMKERPHGFRTSLRVWLAEATNAPHDVAEMCISHMVGSKTVQAYKRTDFLEQRRALMERWSEAVSKKNSASRIFQMAR
ncbi:Phage integrase family protein [Roseovarius lutimaris]|uniref:Phage integrase family protein n=1 Tax=Roseovarius lutimaris TaxID=1005928 RepID=A0A1I5GTG7_9RHOB|nr:site-specific integrase [Roseovarius lutimaris]SFO39298.1 Phage integrase family protein [Roseovarius lutimaris]